MLVLKTQPVTALVVSTCDKGIREETLRMFRKLKENMEQIAKAHENMRA